MNAEKSAYHTKRHTRISITIPIKIRKRMIRLKNKGETINWSQIAAKAFRKYLDQKEV